MAPPSDVYALIYALLALTPCHARYDATTPLLRYMPFRLMPISRRHAIADATCCLLPDATLLLLLMPILLRALLPLRAYRYAIITWLRY